MLQNHETIVHARVGGKIELRLTFQVDDFGTPMVPVVEGMVLGADWQRGLHATPGESERPLTYVCVAGNRQGLTWLAFKCLQLAYAREGGEDWQYHAHIIDPTPPSDSDQVGVVIRLVRGTQ